MTITNGVAEMALGVTGSTPGLNPHAQAEPDWLPVWTVDGDEAAWVAKGRDDDGRWELWCEPERDELWVYLHGLTCQCVTLTPDQARALRHTLGEWLRAVDGGAR